MTHPFTAFLKLCEAAPDALLVAQGDRLATRSDVLLLSGRLSAGLAKEGVKIGDRVLLALPNSIEMIALLPAIWSLGALPMFMSAKATESQMRAVIERYRPSTVATETVLSHLLTGKPALGQHRPHEEADASVVFTSGSSGVPKGVVQKGATLVSGVGRVGRTLGYSVNERILVPIPFAHDYGWGQMLSGLVGGHMIILPARDVLGDIASAINQHRPTVFAGVPSLYSALLFGISGFESADTTSLRLLTSTGSPFSRRIQSALQERIPQARILRNYGLTETYRGCCLHPEDDRGHPGSVGRPIEGVEIRIVDAAGRALPAGQEGEVVHMGAGVFDRYLDDPEATARARRLYEGQPAVFTGDIGVLDEDGRLALLGRRDRLVKSMDIRINLADVEEALDGLSCVRQIAVLSRENESAGHELIAFVVPQGNATPRDIQREANRTLPTHMRPRVVICMTEMPRTSVGKIDYPTLKTILSKNS